MPFRRRALAPPGIFGGVHRSRLGQHRLDLCSLLFALCDALSASFVPSRLSTPSTTMPSAAGSRSTWLNSPPSAPFVPGPEPGDGRMIGAQPASDHPVAHIPHAPLFDHPAGPLALG